MSTSIMQSKALHSSAWTGAGKMNTHPWNHRQCQCSYNNPRRDHLQNNLSTLLQMKTLSSSGRRLVPANYEASIHVNLSSRHSLSYKYASNTKLICRRLAVDITSFQGSSL